MNNLNSLTSFICVFLLYCFFILFFFFSLLLFRLFPITPCLVWFPFLLLSQYYIKQSISSYLLFIIDVLLYCPNHIYSAEHIVNLIFKHLITPTMKKNIRTDDHHLSICISYLSNYLILRRVCWTLFTVFKRNFGKHILVVNWQFWFYPKMSLFCLLTWKTIHKYSCFDIESILNLLVCFSLIQ